MRRTSGGKDSRIAFFFGSDLSLTLILALVVALILVLALVLVLVKGLSSVVTGSVFGVRVTGGIVGPEC